MHNPDAVTNVAIHRVIEQHAATRAACPAIVDTDRTLTYRELNYAANAVARRLAAHGFRRGGHAIVRMPRGGDLAITLLGVLKSGGSYTWSDPGRSRSPLPDGVSLTADAAGTEARYLHIDIAAALAQPGGCSPNLPVMTRGSDLACVLQGDSESPAVLVPHATISALAARGVSHPTPWTGEPGAFDLWMALMAGTTAVVEQQAAASAAA